uniref:MYCBP associated protein n=1 Tax=Naja naja TaxID=35670 RepID=A0A8C6XBV0_NAJNA
MFNFDLTFWRYYLYTAPYIFLEEPEPVSCVLQGDEIQALAIKPEDLAKVGIHFFPNSEKPVVIKKYLIRKSRPQEIGKKANLLVAYPALPDESKKILNYSGTIISIFSCCGSNIVRMIPEESQLSCAISVFGTYRKKPEEKKKVAQSPPSQHRALQNWQRNMAIRRRQQKRLCECLQKSESQLLMNFSEHYRRIQEQRTLIDRSIPAMYSGKVIILQIILLVLFRSEVHPGMILSTHKAIYTLGNCHITFPERLYYTFHLNILILLLNNRRKMNENTVLFLNFPFLRKDLDGLEVIGRNQPFTSVSADSFSACDDVDNKESSEETTSYVGEVGIAARVTFEILVGDKAESLLTVSNDGTTAIWYDWRRLPPPFTFQEKITRGIQNFYFNTRSGVILPGETINFSFIFKSSSGGIFNESWEFSTHPELLGGAMLQVTLWGIALYEDTTVKLREDLEKDLEAREIAVIVEENLEELLNRIRTPARVRSPVDAYVTEEELFHRKNPELHYNHQVVKGLHELWNRVMNPQPVEVYIEEEQGKSTVSETSPSKSTADSQKSPEEIRKSLSSPTFITKSLGLEELVDEPSRTDTEEGALVEEAPHVEWNLSIADFRQVFPEEEEREVALAQLNKAALELCITPLTTQEDLLCQICFQLWREVIDGLVNCSLVLRSLLGMPRKTLTLKLLQKNWVSLPVNSVALTLRKCTQERTNSRKGKGKDEKKARTLTKETKDAISFSIESSEVELQLRREQIDPIVQEKYREKLYVEVSLYIHLTIGKILNYKTKTTINQTKLNSSPKFTRVKSLNEQKSLYLIPKDHSSLVVGK